MNDQTIIGEKVDNGWVPTAQLMAEWRRRPPINLQMVFADDAGLATPTFRAIWLASRATTLSISQPIIQANGRPTEYLLKVIR